MSLMQTNLLHGDNTIPGIRPPEEIASEIPSILQHCRDYGLDFYDTVVEFLDYDAISEIAAYGGFPVRYRHWQFGQEYEELSRGYEYGHHVIYEMVVNTNPCYIYCLASNNKVDHVTVIAHATGHNDFFKNNIYFEKTNQNMMNELANHRTKINRYSKDWNPNVVESFIDSCLSMETLIDPGKAWAKREQKEWSATIKRKFEFPNRIKVREGSEYMDEYLNTPEFIRQEENRIETEELKSLIDALPKPERDIFGYLRDNAPLRPWEQDVICTLYNEAMYFAPQGQTKMVNEGWASKIDSELMARLGLCGQEGIHHYAMHKAGVLGGKYSMNPYKMGFMLLEDIEERWNKGKFGKEYDECDDQRELEAWDKKLGLGHSKIFEVRQYYNDVSMIVDFFTPEFCEKNEFWQWAKFPDGTYKIVSKDHKKIKNSLIKQYLNRGLPIIKLEEPNYKGKNIFMMRHEWEGNTLHKTKTQETLKNLVKIWRNPCALITKDNDLNEIVYYCDAKGKCDIAKSADL